VGRRRLFSGGTQKATQKRGAFFIFTTFTGKNYPMRGALFIFATFTGKNYLMRGALFIFTTFTGKNYPMRGALFIFTTFTGKNYPMSDCWADSVVCAVSSLLASLPASDQSFAAIAACKRCSRWSVAVCTQPYRPATCEGRLATIRQYVRLLRYRSSSSSSVT
jgi:hypothetical protein